MTVPEERRLQRSEEPLVALHYQLAQTRREGRLDAIVVADDAGLVVAGVGGAAVCEELAAYAPLIARGLWNEPRLGQGSGTVTVRSEIEVQMEVLIEVQWVDVEGQIVFLCARGGEGRTRAIRRASSGVARILKRAA